MESLEEASEKRKEKLKNVLLKLMTDKEEMEKRVNSLQESKKKAEEQATSETRRTTELFIELRRKLEDLEKKVLSEISGEAKLIARSANRQIKQLETKKDKIYGKMRHIEELCNMTDPLTVLQDLNMGDLCHTEDGDNKNREEHDKLIYGGGDLDVFKISHTLHTGLSDMRTCVERGKYIPEPADILLDPNTAHINVNISGDRKVASWSDNKQIQKVMAGRFQDYAQVMSSQSFSSGRHYWDVDLQGSHRWRVGVCYPSMDRTGENSLIGNNNKSWGIGMYCNIFKLFSMHNKKCFVVHNSKEIPLPAYTSTKRVRIYLDYEAGKISFYDVCDPIHLLYTFTATFTEPLHAVFSGCVKLSGQ
ncbi:E3 ubiquitin-protein ligase TRIM21-like [Pyxicephalus adspersus]|uniref:E3 ubiquitin-protein ligase TRIM21-like n=1 Tax=Pyxicephalus adspersus TaxID=30357 RepID=UPI003B5BB369